MEPSISASYETCRLSFQKLILALQKPARDFSEHMNIATVRDKHGLFEVWAGNVGARHDSKSRVSLDYRLREASFYRERVLSLLQDLNRTLQRGRLISSNDRVFSDNV